MNEGVHTTDAPLLLHPMIHVGVSLRESKRTDFQLNLTPMMRKSQLKSKWYPLLGLRRECVIQPGGEGLPRAYFHLKD